jgi:hypothetical protein
MSSCNNTTSPYISFCNAKRHEVKAANPNAAFGDIAKLLRNIWNELSESEKASYNHKNNEDVNGQPEPVVRRSNRLRNKRLGLNFWGIKL